jgi:methyl-accepting chemotaxis protein
VAGEVRSLAQRSAAAASEIKTLIDGTVGGIKNGDEMMKKTSASWRSSCPRWRSSSG